MDSKTGPRCSIAPTNQASFHAVCAMPAELESLAVRILVDRCSQQTVRLRWMWHSFLRHPTIGEKFVYRTNAGSDRNVGRIKHWDWQGKDCKSRHFQKIDRILVEKRQLTKLYLWTKGKKQMANGVSLCWVKARSKWSQTSSRQVRSRKATAWNFMIARWEFFKQWPT